MFIRRFWILGTAAAALVLISTVRSQDTPKAATAKAARPASTGPKTAKIEKGLILVDLNLKGTLEAEQASEISIELKSWTLPLVVRKAVPHGTPVKSGDVLVELETDKIDRAIRELRFERELGELSLRLAEDELPVLEKSLPVELAAAERSSKIAEDDLKRFLEVDRPLGELAAEFSVKASKQFLENAREELTQLERMYRDKDLTEETEEIILKRQRFSVEQSEFSLKNAENRREVALKVELPRREISAREAATKAALAYEKARSSLPLSVQQKRIALNKLRYETSRTAERLSELEQDREAMIIRAQADGLAYHGRNQQGQWSTASATARLQKGGTLSSQDVFMTIVAARPLRLRVDVEEKDLHLLQEGATGQARPVGYPDQKIPARITKVGGVPVGPGKFDAMIALDLPDSASQLVPGLACNLRVVAYRKDDALLAPAGSVFSDDQGESHFVFLPGEKPERRSVWVGKSSGSKTEILGGLKEGDEILVDRP